MSIFGIFGHMHVPFGQAILAWYLASGADTLTEIRLDLCYIGEKYRIYDHITSDITKIQPNTPILSKKCRQTHRQMSRAAVLLFS